MQPSETEPSQLNHLLPSPSALKHELPLTPQQERFIQNARAQITAILEGRDTRLLLIVGPCSIHDLAAAEEYASRLSTLANTFSDKFYILMRAYFEKPRTALGWKGLLYDPYLNGSDDLVAGLIHSRQLLLSLANQQLPAATEFLDPVTPHYIGDLISWACIGARTSESQVHRQIASGLPMPIAFKNSTSGSVEVAVNGVLSARSPHAFFSIDEQGRLTIKRTQGNPHTHIVLRGGQEGPNYDEESLQYAVELLHQAKLPEWLLVDCSHDNSLRCHEKQEVVFTSVIEQYRRGNRAIRGLCLESHLYGGNQQMSGDLDTLRYAVSLTDPCLDWENTERLVRWGAEQLG